MENQTTEMTFVQRLKRFGAAENAPRRKKFYYILSLLPLVGMIALFFAPLCEIPIEDEDIIHKITAAGCFEALNSENAAIASFAALQVISFLLIVGAILVSLALFIKLMMSSSSEKRMYKTTKLIVLIDLVFTVGYTALTVLIAPLNTLLGGMSGVSLELFPVGYVLVCGALFAVFAGVMSFSKERTDDEELLDENELNDVTQKRRKLFYVRLELFVYAAVSAVVSIIALLSNIVTVNFTSDMIFIPSIVISGKDLLFDPASLVGEGKQLLGYVVFLLFVVSFMMLYLCAVAFFTRSSTFNRIGICTVGISAAVTLAIGLLGKYYDIVQHVNDGMIADILSEYALSQIDLYDYEVVSDSIFFFLISVAVLTVMFIRRTYTKAESLAGEVAALDAAKQARMAGGAPRRRRPISDGATVLSATGGAMMSGGQNPDPCPSFTAIDDRVEEFDIELAERRKALFEDPSLPNLVDFIVQYARDSKQHLFYTRESIAEFLAGLGTTRLSILQGMSGTGKTSLPKIVAEALYSVCDIVEVESSWRDKHELLGYYNEFSKTYTPKKFTEALYKATLNPEVITFIVLDEMNLSRIEYYFSDFLSLMEHEPDKRDLKLLNTPMVRTNGEEVEEYFGLIHGHTVRIPENVWFIGTANRDESTYDISDKVYDRAHTMNFDKRAERVKYYNDPSEPRYISVDQLTGLFNEAKSRFDFSIEQYPVIAEVEKLLKPYNISFGNRIAVQMESFVKVYTSCFTVNENVIRDGLEIILLSKVVRKLELKNVEDKEALAADFARLQLNRCSEFILSLKED